MDLNPWDNVKKDLSQIKKAADSAKAVCQEQTAPLCLQYSEKKDILA